MKDAVFTGTITIFPEYATLSEDFRKKLRAAAASKAATLTYNDTTFLLEEGEGAFEAKVVLDSLDAPLPSAFDGDNVTVNHVILLCDIPSTPLKAKPGWYVGENYDLPGACCSVDPRGEWSDGKPTIYAVGDVYTHVTTLFKRVMAGELEPVPNDHLNCS